MNIERDKKGKSHSMEKKLYHFKKQPRRAAFCLDDVKVF